MKLKQFHNYTLVVFEINDAMLKVTPKKILNRKTQEFLFQNILIKDIYEIKHHDRYAYGYVAFFLTFLIHFAVESILNPNTDRTMVIVFSILTVLSIVRVFFTRTKIYIPTKDQGLIKLYKKKPSRKKVQEFIYVLEGRALLAAKKVSAKPDLKEFIWE